MFQITHENFKIITVKSQITETFDTYFCNVDTKILNETKFHHDNNINTNVRKIDNNIHSIFFLARLVLKISIIFGQNLKLRLYHVNKIINNEALFRRENITYKYKSIILK